MIRLVDVLGRYCLGRPEVDLYAAFANEPPVIPGLAEGENPEPMNAMFAEKRGGDAASFDKRGFASSCFRRRFLKSVFMGSGFAFGDPE
jgi:hypothetical protein